MYNKYKQRFAIKKFTIGVASVFLGGTALMATDVLPFNMANVASASEEELYGEVIEGIEYKVRNNNGKGYSLNGKSENAILYLKGVNPQAQADSISIVVEKTGPVDVSMKSPDPSIKSETIGNTTRMKLGSFTEGSYYSIPIFTKYKENTDNGTNNELTIKVVNDVTGDVLYSYIIRQVNKASEITEITLDDNITFSGKYNVPKNQVVKLDLSDDYYNSSSEYIIHSNEYNLSDSMLPKGGDYLKKTILSGDDKFENANGKIRLKEETNRGEKITEPLVVKYEVVNSRGEKKGIEKTVTYNFEYEDVYDYTAFEEIEKPEKVYFSPSITDSSLKDGNIIISNEGSSNRYFGSVEASLKEALYVETETTNTPNVNYIRYAHKEYNPKDFKMSVLENNLTSPLTFNVHIQFPPSTTGTKNIEKGKIYIKTNNQKEYIFGDDTIYDIVNNYKKYKDILTISADTDNYANADTLEEYFKKYYSMNIQEAFGEFLKSATINISDIDNIQEIGIDFPEDTIVKTNKEGYIDKSNVEDADLNDKKELLPSDLVKIQVLINGLYEKNKDTLLKINSAISYYDSETVTKTKDIFVKNMETPLWTPPFFVTNVEETLEDAEDNTIRNIHRENPLNVFNKKSKYKTRILSKHITGLTTHADKKEESSEITVGEEEINGEKYTILSSGYNPDNARFGSSIYNFDANLFSFKYTPNADMYKLNKNERGEIEFPDIEYLLQIPKEIMEYVKIPEQWVKVDRLSTGIYNTYRHIHTLKVKTVPAEGFVLNDSIKNTSGTEKIKKDDLLDITTNINNNQASSVSNLSVIKVVPKTGNLALNGDKVTDSLDTDFVDIVGDTNNWNIYYSTTVRQQGESVSTITDWAQEMPSDKSTITHVKWVRKTNISGNSGDVVGFKVKSKELNNTEDNKIVTEENSTVNYSWKLNTISGFNLGNNDTYGGSISANSEIKIPNYQKITNYFIDKNNNKTQDDDEIGLSIQSDNNQIGISGLMEAFNEAMTYTSNYDPRQIDTFLKEITKYNVIEIGEGVGTTSELNEDGPIGFTPEIPVYNYYLKVEEAQPLTINYYDVEYEDVIVKTETFKSTEIKSSIPVSTLLKTKIKDENNNEWEVDLETRHINRENGLDHYGRYDYSLRNGILEYHKQPDLHYYGQPLVFEIPVKKKPTGSVNVVLVDKTTGEPLKVTNIVTENSKPEGERVVIEESDAPEYITIGGVTYKKVEKPNLPTEAIVPGATDNADVEFEYEVVRGAVYGVFKAEDGNNIIKDKVTIIEGGQPEDTTREYTAPSRITDDNGKVWELVSPTGSVSYTNGENATEHILTYREVKKDVTLKYVTSTGETIKEEVAFENKSVGSKYRINTPETITKDNEIYNVSGEREIAGAVEDNDNIITIEVTPKPKQVAIIKFVDNNGEEISGIERKRVEGYDGTNINVTLENIPNYRITNNPFETTQVFDTDNNVDQEFSVVLERTQTTAIPFETEYVADETREYGSENITEREGVEGEREDNGEITRQPVNKIVKVATGSKVERKETPFNVIYEADESRAFGDNSVINGFNKVEEITTTYTLNTTTGVVTPNTPTTVVVDAGTSETHIFGTQPSVTTEDIPFETEYVGDNTVDYGTENVNTEGVTGVRTTTITYRLDGDSHTVVANNPIVDTTKQPVNKVVAKGTKTTTVTEDIPFIIEYIEDNTLDYGTENVYTEGVNGVKTTTTTYRLDGDTVIANEPVVSITKQPTSKVITKGTKPTETVISETAFTTITKEDPTLTKGEEVVEVEGVNGKTVNITEYTVNRETGEVTSTTREEVREAVNKVVRVGTKEAPANETTEETPNTNNENNNTTEDNSNENGTTETTEDTTTGNENTNVEENNSETETVTEETTEENSLTTETTEVETDTLTAEEEKAKEDKHSDAWEESANEYNKQKETVDNGISKENNNAVKVENKTVKQEAVVKAKELPKTNSNNTLLYTATALIGLATLLRRKESKQ